MVRHALPQRVEVVGRAADPPLAASGHRQARALADRLAADGIDGLYTSPLRRARETAHPLAAALGLDALVVDGVAEFDRDAEDYVPMEELKAANDPRWHELVVGRVLRQRLDRRHRVPSRPWCRRSTASSPPTAHARAAVVCHGGVINAYVGHVLGLDDFMVFEPMYTGITRIRASSAGHRSS